MLYSIGDRFLIGDLLVEVKYTNAGMAWVAPLEDFEIGYIKYFSCATFDVLDEDGLDSYGDEAQPVKPSAAV